MTEEMGIRTVDDIWLWIDFNLSSPSEWYGVRKTISQDFQWYPGISSGNPPVRLQTLQKTEFYIKHIHGEKVTVTKSFLVSFEK